MKTNRTSTATSGRQHRMAGAALFALALALGALVDTVTAGAPEYMKLDPQVGLALEIEGYWDSAGVFVAEDIARLPRPRSPKVRGVIQSIDAQTRTLTVYGQPIKIHEATEFVQDGGSRVDFDKLKVGQRVEISCKRDSSGAWEARKVTARGVKDSDKVKGTITRLHVDGEAPDTVVMDGLPILLLRESDVLDSESAIDPTEDELFGNLVGPSVTGKGGGLMVGRSVYVRGEYRQNVASRTDYDLTPTFESDERSTEQDVRLEATAFLSPRLRAQAELRLRKRYWLVNDRNLPDDEIRAHFTQLFVLVRPHPGSGWALQIGRQEFDEPREWLFDEYLDAARVFYYGGSPWVADLAVIHAVDPIKAKFETWTDLFAQVRWFQNDDNLWSAYMLLRRDSDEIRNREPVWWGLRYGGRPARNVRGWADLALMRGEDKGRALEAWAVDVGATVTASGMDFMPSLTLAYAVGSGDDPNAGDADNRFRQTGYQDNVDRFGGVSSFEYYGSILDPELSNVRIVTLGLGVRPAYGTSIDVVYHRYRQVELDDEVKGSDLLDPPARPNGIEEDLGWALDLVLGLPPLWEVVQIKGLLGYFNPGPAYAPRDNTALLGKVNVRIGV